MVDGRQNSVIPCPPRKSQLNYVLLAVAAMAALCDSHLLTCVVQERRHDPKRGMSLLVEDWVSRASALQRKGRAGRVRAGMCWGLYTRHRFEQRLRRYQVAF